MRSIWRRRLSNGRHACEAVGRSIGFSSVFAGTLVAGSAMIVLLSYGVGREKTTRINLSPSRLVPVEPWGAMDIAKAFGIGWASVSDARKQLRPRDQLNIA